MKKLLHFLLLCLFISSCESSDIENIVDISELQIGVAGTGTDRIALSGNIHSGWWEYKEKGTSNYLKSDARNYLDGLKSGTTYELIYKNNNSQSQTFTATTRSLVFDYTKIINQNNCLLERNSIQTSREYTFYTKNEIQHSKVDLYLINKTRTDSIAVTTKIGLDKKSIIFTLPQDYLMDSLLPEQVAFGFKVGAKMEYFFNKLHDYYSEGSFFDENQYVKTENHNDYENLIYRFYVENSTPYFATIRTINRNKYHIIVINGRFHEFSITKNANCIKDNLPQQMELIVFKEDQKTIIYQLRRDHNSPANNDEIFSFATYYNFDLTSTLREGTLLTSNQLQFDINLLPAGKYYLQYQAFFEDGTLLKSNKIPYETQGIMP